MRNPRNDTLAVKPVPAARLAYLLLGRGRCDVVPNASHIGATAPSRERDWLS